MKHSLSWGCGLVALAVIAAPARSAEIGWDQLSRRKIHVTFTQTRRVQLQEGGTYTDRHVWNFVITPGPDGELKYSRQDTGRWLDKPGSGRPRASPVRTANTAVGKVHPNPDGFGTAVWTFENGIMKRLSVETAGTKGREFAISFEPNDKGLNCKAEINEVGVVGQSKTWVNEKGQWRKLISIADQAASCKID